MSLLHSKVWVQNTHRYPISINVKQLREILDPNEPMHKDCFNMGVRMLAVAEPPELSRLKCAGHYHKGNTDSNALQTEQFLFCRVTSGCNHRFSDRTSIPRTKASPEISQPYILQHRHSIYYIKFKVLNTDTNLVKHYTIHKFNFRV